MFLINHWNYQTDWNLYFQKADRWQKKLLFFLSSEYFGKHDILKFIGSFSILALYLSDDLKLLKMNFAKQIDLGIQRIREEFLNRQMEGLELLFDFWGIFYDPIVFKFKLIHFSVKHLLTDRPERTSELRKISNC